MLRRYAISALALFVLLLFVPAPADALWWMVYHKPAFKGRVLDAETKAPIEGAVVVVAYYKESPNWPAGNIQSAIEVKEALTDKDGAFHIPSYTSVVQPLSWEEWARFIIFKPGYGNYPNQHASPPQGVNPEKFFSGKTGERGGAWITIKARRPGAGLMERVEVPITYGLVELPRLKTREERANSTHITITGYGSKKLPLLYRALNEELSSLGFPLYDLRKL